MRFSAADLAVRLAGELVGPDVVVDGAGIDFRTIRALRALTAAEAPSPKG